MGTGHRGRDQVADRPHREAQIQSGRRLGERGLERTDLHPVGQLDDEHHRELARQDRHRAVLEVAPQLEQGSRDRRGNAGPVGSERPHHAAFHAHPSSCSRASDKPEVVPDLVEHGDAHAAGEIGFVARQRAQRAAEDRDAIRHHPA